MRFIARGVPERQEMIDALTEALPEIEWCIDRARDPMGNMAAALLLQGDDEGAVHLEEDITLTAGFRAKVDDAIAGHEGDVVQMFSLRQGESRWDTSFRMNQCFYVPPGLAGTLASDILTYPRRDPANPTAYDYAISDTLRRLRRRYWLHHPSLVQHHSAPSQISPRSSARQSPTWRP